MLTCTAWGLRGNVGCSALRSSGRIPTFWKNLPLLWPMKIEAVCSTQNYIAQQLIKPPFVQFNLAFKAGARNKVLKNTELNTRCFLSFLSPFGGKSETSVAFSLGLYMCWDAHTLLSVPQSFDVSPVSRIAIFVTHCLRQVNRLCNFSTVVSILFNTRNSNHTVSLYTHQEHYKSDINCTGVGISTGGAGVSPPLLTNFNISLFLPEDRFRLPT